MKIAKYNWKCRLKPCPGKFSVWQCNRGRLVLRTKTKWKRQATAKTNMLAAHDAKLEKLRVIGATVSRLHFDQCKYCKAPVLDYVAICLGNSLASLWFRGVPTLMRWFAELCDKQITRRKSDWHFTNAKPFANITRMAQCISPHHDGTFLPFGLGVVNERYSSAEGMRLRLVLESWISTQNTKNNP